MIRSNRNKELLKTVSGNEGLGGAQHGHKRSVTSSPGSHISAFCHYVASYPRISRCSAQHMNVI